MHCVVSLAHRLAVLFARVVRDAESLRHDKRQTVAVTCNRAAGQYKVPSLSIRKPLTSSVVEPLMSKRGSLPCWPGAANSQSEESVLRGSQPSIDGVRLQLLIG